jgi:hypothetical protein
LKTKYQNLLVRELDRLREQVGEAKMQEIYQNLKAEGQEAMSRELILQLISRHFGLRSRIKFLMQHWDLMIPFLFRIKINIKEGR